jgi:hypothetical protein
VEYRESNGTDLEIYVQGKIRFTVCSTDLTTGTESRFVRSYVVTCDPTLVQKNKLLSKIGKKKVIQFLFVFGASLALLDHIALCSFF